MVSHAYKLGLIEAVAYPQTKVFEARHAVRAHRGYRPGAGTVPRHSAAVDEAIKAREEGKKKVILFNLSGHGLLDLAAYDSYLAGHLKDG